MGQTGSVAHIGQLCLQFSQDVPIEKENQEDLCVDGRGILERILGWRCGLYSGSSWQGRRAAVVNTVTNYRSP